MTGHFLGTEMREEAAAVLQKTLGPDPETYGSWLHAHLDERAPGAERILAADLLEGSSELAYRELPRAVVDLFGNEIFAGEFGAKLRSQILCQILKGKEYHRILNIYLGSVRGDECAKARREFSSDKQSAAGRFVDKLGRHPWHPGKRYALGFVKELRLDDAFAGFPGEPAQDRIEEVTPRVKVPKLTSFQENMKSQILQMLRRRAGGRAIVTLPTGAGKTRIVVDAVTDLLNERGTDRNILWIAQSQEVCEQAVLCFKQMWEHRGQGKTLNIFRAWGDRDVPGPDEHGVVVGGVGKLSRSDDLCSMSDDGSLDAVLVDEAHHSVAPSYVRILDGLGMSPYPSGRRENDRVPLIGLTATPERTDSYETRRLHRMYGDSRIFPRPAFSPASDKGVGFEGWECLDRMKENLIELGYLARARFRLLDPGVGEIRLAEEETQSLENGKDAWLQNIATEPERNRNIKNEILQWARKGKKILYFGTNVAQSNAMAKILERSGIRSACITGDTRYATRRMMVNAFNKTDDIQVMCNYNVLSTGFDSPKIDTVIIARPTTSIVSYQQMVGRGLRGAEFGGRSENQCDIVTVADNIVKFTDERVDLVYSRFSQDGR